MTISEAKVQARKKAFAARKLANGQGLDIAACRNLSKYLGTLPKFLIVAAYMPIRTEISPIDVMAELDAAGKIVCVPVIQGAGLPLKFSRWRPGADLVEGRFGAMIPQKDDFFDPDLLITPLVAFDAQGYRLGYGGGFYDRSFEGLKAKKPITGVGFAYGAQELPLVPTEPTDQRLDAIVTEAGVLTF